MDTSKKYIRQTVDDKTLKFWTENRFKKDYELISVELGVNFKTIQNALKHGYCTDENAKLITAFFKKRIKKLSKM